MSQKHLKSLTADDFTAFDEAHGEIPILIDIVYAQKDHPHNIFETQIYKTDAKIWCYTPLYNLTMRAAEICYARSGFYFEIKDALRPTDAQKKMIETPIVQKNLHWVESDAALLSKPGGGGHPRGMAIDIILVDENRNDVNMGTHFDFFSEDPNDNPAARDFVGLSDQIYKNRAYLCDSMMDAAAEMNIDLVPLPQEWWDFRLPSAFSNQFSPLSDDDLPDHMKMTM